MKGRRILLVVAVAVPALLGCWAFWLEPASLRLETLSVSLERLPEPCDGLRVALLADLHVGSPFNGPARLEKVVQMTQEAEPDLVLLLGDYVIRGVVGGRFVPPEPMARILSRLAAPLGVFAVLGNHDWWFDAPRVQASLESHGIPVLEDRAARVTGSPCDLWVAGISDYWEGAHDVDRALAGVADKAPVIAFTHNPDIFPDIPEGVLLTVAGHTHGGQVRFPLVGRPIVPSEFGQRYAAGHVREGERDLFVSTGVGTSILPVRFLVPPVVTLLVLESGVSHAPIATADGRAADQGPF
jgi:predicted MPP superfamily phosphohydrolase